MWTVGGEALSQHYCFILPCKFRFPFSLALYSQSLLVKCSIVFFTVFSLGNKRLIRNFCKIEKKITLGILWGGFQIQAQDSSLSLCLERSFSQAVSPQTALWSLYSNRTSLCGEMIMSRLFQPSSYMAVLPADFGEGNSRYSSVFSFQSQLPTVPSHEV